MIAIKKPRMSFYFIESIVFGKYILLEKCYHNKVEATYELKMMEKEHPSGPDEITQSRRIAKFKRVK